MAGAGDRQAGLEQLLHQIGTLRNVNFRVILHKANDRHAFHIAPDAGLMQIGRMERALIFGASRGLGAELVRHLGAVGYPTLGFGRKRDRLQKLREEWPLFAYEVADFSVQAAQNELLEVLRREDFDRLFYVAGGGPYGAFHQRGWKDHLWALEVSFLFPARILHFMREVKPDVQIIAVGSSVAETGEDVNAASYCAAKCALRALIQTLRAETPGWDLRLFSPGYIDTEMLPANAAVRQMGVYNPAELARDLWTWSLSADDSGHKVYPKHPG